MKKLRVMECFAGIGACSKALERLNIPHEIVDAVEIDKYAIQSFNAIHGTNFEPQDITTWDKDIKVDLIMHGSPCQDFSLAGKQAGGDKDSGTRSSLMYETIRIVEKLKPKYVVWENVKNLLSKKHRHNFDAYLQTMEQLGYTNYYQVLNAKDYGIPQNRERVFTVSILGNENYEFPKVQELEKIPLDFIEKNVDKKYDLTDKNIKHYQREFGSKGKELNLYEPIPTLTASMGTGGGNIPYFTFPPKQELKLKLKDMLEDEVDEKYYLTNSMIQYLEHGKYQSAKVSSKLKQTDTGISPTLDTMQGGNRQPFIKVKNATKKGYLEAHDGDGIDISARMEHHRGTVQKDKIQTLTTSGGNDRGVVVNDNNIYNLFFTIFGLCCIINTKEKDKYERSRELLQILWEEIGKEEIRQEIRRFISIQEKKILQSNLYENELYEDRKPQSKISTSTSNSSEYNESITNREKMFNMWEEWKTRYTPQRWELSKQQFRQFNLFMQELSYETTQGETSMQDMWQSNERFRILQQTLFKIQEIWEPYENKISNGLRIRKLTPREAFRLMGFDDEDFEKAEKINSNTQLYKQAGNSIVVTVLEAIFTELFKEYIPNLDKWSDLD